MSPSLSVLLPPARLFCPDTLVHVAHTHHHPPTTPNETGTFSKVDEEADTRRPAPTTGAAAAGAAGEAAAAALRPSRAPAAKGHTQPLQDNKQHHFFDPIVRSSGHNHVRLRDGAPQTAAARYVGLF